MGERDEEKLTQELDIHPTNLEQVGWWVGRSLTRRGIGEKGDVLACSRIEAGGLTARERGVGKRS